MHYCNHRNPTHHIEWVDTSLPFFKSFKSDLFCEACADSLEGVEGIEIVACVPLAATR